MSYPNMIFGTEEETWNTYTDERHPVGTKMAIEDGRIFRYASASAAATIVGSVYQGLLWDLAKWGDQAIASKAVGATVLTGVGATTTNFAASKLKNGYFWSDSAAQLGPAQRVKDNILITAAATSGTITLYNPLQLAITTATHQASYIGSIWRDVIVSAAPATACHAGVGVSIIAIASYGWLQTGGACKVLTEGTVVEGDIVVGSATDYGVMPSAAFETDGPELGRVQGDNASTEFALIHLTLD